MVISDWIGARTPLPIRAQFLSFSGDRTAPAAADVEQKNHQNLRIVSMRSINEPRHPQI